MTKSEKEQYSKVARLGCALCRHLGLPYDGGVEIHHIRRFGGKRANAPFIGLCVEHHRGNTGVHGLGAKGFEKHYQIGQEDLLEMTEKLLANT
jgi:hypothetical protein